MSQLPDDIADAVQSYITTKSAELPWPVETASAEFLRHGERHDLIAIPAADGAPGRILLRIPRADEGAEMAGRSSREARVLAALPSGLAPRLYWFDERGILGRPTSALEYVTGRTLSLSGLTAGQAAALGRGLAVIHASPAPGLPPIAASLEETLVTRVGHELDRRLSAPHLQSGPAARAAARFLPHYGLTVRWVLDALATGAFSGGAPALSHGDLGSENILWSRGGKPVFIDWENARVSDPAEEVAYLFAENAVDDQTRRAIREGYETAAGGSGRFWDRVAYYLPLAALGSAAWWLDRYGRRLAAETAGSGHPDVPEQADYYYERMQARLVQAEAELANTAELTSRAVGPPVGLARQARE